MVGAIVRDGLVSRKYTFDGCSGLPALSMGVPDYPRKDRKKVEMLFVHLKRLLKLDRLRLRGPHGAKDEFMLATTAQNLRRLAMRLFNSPPNPPFVPT